MRITPHLPGFLDLTPPGPAEFASVAELGRVPWVAARAGRPGFVRFSVNAGEPPPLLMAEFADGVRRVIGYLSDDVDLTPSPRRSPCDP